MLGISDIHILLDQYSKSEAFLILEAVFENFFHQASVIYAFNLAQKKLKTIILIKRKLKTNVWLCDNIENVFEIYNSYDKKKYENLFVHRIS